MYKEFPKMEHDKKNNDNNDKKREKNKTLVN